MASSCSQIYSDKEIDGKERCCGLWPVLGTYQETVTRFTVGFDMGDGGHSIMNFNLGYGLRMVSLPSSSHTDQFQISGTDVCEPFRVLGGFVTSSHESSHIPFYHS